MRAGSSVLWPRSAAPACGLEARDGVRCYALANQTQEATRRQAGARLSVKDVGQARAPLGAAVGIVGLVRRKNQAPRMRESAMPA